MGPTRLRLGQAGHRRHRGVRGGRRLELALWCDLGVALEEAILGVFCRRFGVPLVDLGTVRLPRNVGLGRAIDLILTGRPVTAQEAWTMGLLSRVVPRGQALRAALELARALAALEACMRKRMSLLESLDLGEQEAMENEVARDASRSAAVSMGRRRPVRGRGRASRAIRNDPAFDETDLGTV